MVISALFKIVSPKKFKLSSCGFKFVHLTNFITQFTFHCGVLIKLLSHGFIVEIGCSKFVKG